MLYQNSSCTSTGVPRKNQMYSQLAPDTSGFGESRMTARATPERDADRHRDHGQLDRHTQAFEDPFVGKVAPRPRSHSNLGLVAIEWTIATATIRTIAPASQRPGRRTGTARISVGPSLAVGGL